MQVKSGDNITNEGNFEQNRLSYREAISSPCASCATSPCCTHLPLHTFKVTNLIELDHAVYLLNFDRIELGLSASGEWSVYYRYPCRFLNREDFRCTIHNTPQQPNICVTYNPYSCWYKRVMTKSVSDEFLLINKQRLEFILERVVFDESRQILEVPSWETLVEGFANIPLQPNSKFDEFVKTEDSATKAWENLVLKGDNEGSISRELYTYKADSLQNPCSNCEAHCCKTLVFPQTSPSSTTSLDFFRFCLGFPGVELGITDNSWSIVVKTTCNHLQDNLCSIYDKPERPLICKYYNAWTCTYKPQFGLPRPNGFVRIKLEQFEWLTECFGLDEAGAIVQFPTVEFIRNHVEQRWRGEAAQQSFPATS